MSESVGNLLQSEGDTDWQSTQGQGGEGDTVVFPLLQMGLYGIHQEQEVTTRLLAGLGEGERLHLASGYFNLPPQYTSALLAAAGDVSVLAASPQVIHTYSRS